VRGVEKEQREVVGGWLGGNQRLIVKQVGVNRVIEGQ
jgi:hypothetical protein